VQRIARLHCTSSARRRQCKRESQQNTAPITIHEQAKAVNGLGRRMPTWSVASAFSGLKGPCCCWTMSLGSATGVKLREESWPGKNGCHPSYAVLAWGAGWVSTGHGCWHCRGGSGQDRTEKARLTGTAPPGSWRPFALPAPPKTTRTDGRPWRARCVRQRRS
jgi:hypothetical protein